MIGLGLNHIPANSQKYLYIFKDEVGRHKIGVTKNVPSRKKGLEQASGLCLDTVYFKYLGSVATKYEKRLHDHYKDYNTSGEWFNFSKKENFSDKDLIEEVKALIETYERIKPTYENNIPQDLITEATALQNMLENLVTKSSLKVINILLERKLNRLAGYHNKFSSTKLLKEIVYTDDLNSMYALIVSQKTIIRFLNVGVSNYHTIAAVFDVITHKNKHILAASKV